MFTLYALGPLLVTEMDTGVCDAQWGGSRAGRAVAHLYQVHLPGCGRETGAWRVGPWAARKRELGREHSVIATAYSREAILSMCILALFLRPEMTPKPPVLEEHGVASRKLLQPRLMLQIQFNKHVPSGTVTGGRVGPQDARDPALRTAQGEPDDRKVRSTGRRASSTFRCDCQVPSPPVLWLWS